VWAEPFTSPPAIYYEGEQFSMDELDDIVEKIMSNPALRADGTFRCRWVGKRND
jgi:hypothetical protein